MTEPLAMASKARHNVEVMVLLATMVLDDVVFLKAILGNEDLERVRNYEWKR